MGNSQSRSAAADGVDAALQLSKTTQTPKGGVKKQKEQKEQKEQSKKGALVDDGELMAVVDEEEVRIPSSEWMHGGSTCPCCPSCSCSCSCLDMSIRLVRTGPMRLPSLFLLALVPPTSPLGAKTDQSNNASPLSSS